MVYGRRYRRRRRRRNSHYGIVVLLILLVVVIGFVGIKIIGSIGAALSGGSIKNEVVFQMDNPKAISNKDLVDIGAAPYQDAAGNTMIPLRALSDSFGLELEWEQVSRTATVQLKKDTYRLQVGSKTMRVNDETQTLSVAPVITNGATFVPVKDLCEAFSWQLGQTDVANGEFVIVSKSKKELTEQKIGEVSTAALQRLGPSCKQVAADALLMRVDSDKIQQGNQTLSMKSSIKNTKSVIQQEGAYDIPLQPAMEALGYTVENQTNKDKQDWTITKPDADYEATVTSAGKIKVNGKNVKTADGAVYIDTETAAGYVSAEAFAALTNTYFCDLGDGSLAFTAMPLDGFDLQKNYLTSGTDSLTGAAAEFDIPDADVYIALTFDDGPTGATDAYPNGLTATLLDGLQERDVHATFLMCGYRLQDFHSHCARYLAEGHELGNHTMNHPMSGLPALSDDEIRSEIEENSKLIEQYCGARPTVMRPVGGEYNDNVQAVMKELGLPIINWDVDTLDWKTKTDPQSVKTNLVDQVQDGSIVLMHDMYPGTVEGVLAAIDELQARTDKTYAFVTVSELAAAKGITLKPGKVYTNIDYAASQQNTDSADASDDESTLDADAQAEAA